MILSAYDNEHCHWESSS